MNKKLEQRLIEISKALKPQKANGQRFHTCFAIRRGKISAIGWNDYSKGHPEKRFGKYLAHKNYGTDYKPCLHAETKMLLRLGEEDLSDYEVVNVRISNYGEPIMSRFCPNCLNVISQLNPKRMFYTNNNGEFEQI